jgi:hypothetical protein
MAKDKIERLKITNPDDFRKVIILRSGALMDIEEWTNIPASGTSKTEDADFEIIQPKQLPSNDRTNNQPEPC